MNSQRKHLWHVIFYCFKEGDSENDTADICIVYRNGAITITTIHNWFKRYKAGNFDLKNERTYGRSAMTNTDLIKAMLAENPRYSVQEIVDAINISRKTVDNHVTTAIDENRLYEIKSLCAISFFRDMKEIKYCNQLDKLKTAIVEKWPELANRRDHDNTKPPIE
ncbi:uncharacterized protein LOC102653572, partial [Apis mellifera]|uniref:Uncharacterized protein LOC102653572 n=1 Tax=Apis mellifera TaxID=7460 RepID=A0A7M7MVS0_APIME